MKRKRVLFVCLGNLCRSPMAEAIASEGWGDEVDVESGGIIASDGAAAPPEAIEVGREKGLDLTRHRARHVSSLDLSSYDRIVAMTPEIADRLQRDFGARSDQLIVLDISDPYGASIASYREMSRALERELPRVRERIPVNEPNRDAAPAE